MVCGEVCWYLSLSKIKSKIPRFPRLLVCSRRPDLHVPGVTRGRGSVFKAHSAGTPLNAEELKV